MRYHLAVGVGVNSLTAQPIQAFRGAVCAANHLTDADKQTVQENTQTQYNSEKKHRIQQNKTTVVQSPLKTLGQETRWANSAMRPSPHWAI